MKEKKNYKRFEIPKTVISESVHDNLIQQISSQFGSGGINYNIIYMVFTITGCMFTLIPYYGKKTGLFMMTILLIIPAFISYTSSMLLYWGFKVTKAEAYSECMRIILGSKIGFISNVVIFIHTFALVVCCWMFSFWFLDFTLQAIFKITDEEKSHNFTTIFTYIYFYLVGFLILFTSNSRKYHILKKISFLGVLVLVYLIIVIIYQTPLYYSDLKKKDAISITGFIFDHNIFKAWGLTTFLFLNQYSILPVCNNMSRISNKKMSKAMSRTILGSLIIYLIVLYCGYLSLPNNIEECDFIFVLKKPLETFSDLPMLIGIGLFGLALLLGMLIKGHYFILYFHHILDNSNFFYHSLINEDLEEEQEDFYGRIEEVDEDEEGKSCNTNILDQNIINQQIHEFNEDEEGKNVNRNILDQKIPDCEEEDEVDFNENILDSLDEKNYDEYYDKTPFNLNDNSKKKNSDQSEFIQGNKKEQNTKINSAISQKKKNQNSKKKTYSRYDLVSEVLEQNDSTLKTADEKSSKRLVINILFMLVITHIMLLLKKKLKETLYLIGNFVGILEIIVFPLIMILILNRGNNFLSVYKKVFLFIVAVFFIFFSILSVIYSVVDPDNSH